MSKIYYQSDCDINVLKNKTVENLMFPTVFMAKDTQVDTMNCF